MPMTLAPGTQFGTYEVIGALGSGGMGEVYRARDSKLHRDVAIKVLPKSLRPTLNVWRASSARRRSSPP